MIKSSCLTSGVSVAMIQLGEFAQKPSEYLQLTKQIKEKIFVVKRQQKTESAFKRALTAEKLTLTSVGLNTPLGDVCWWEQTLANNAHPRNEPSLRSTYQSQLISVLKIVRHLHLSHSSNQLTCFVSLIQRVYCGLSPIYPHQKNRDDNGYEKTRISYRVQKDISLSLRIAPPKILLLLGERRHLNGQIILH